MTRLANLLAVAMLGLIPSASHAQGSASAEVWKVVFPDAAAPSAANIDTRAQHFFDTVGNHIDLLERLPVSRSSARRVTVLPDESYPLSRNPTFLYEEEVLVVAPLCGCEVGHEDAYVVANLHDFAHGVFAANVYAALHLDPARAFTGRYDPKAAHDRNREQELSKAVPYGDLVVPFAEVFADAFAVLALDDPAAVSRALHECGYDGARDFAGSYDADHWDGGDLKPIAVTFSNPDPYGPQAASAAPRYYVFPANVHDVLSPLRSATWTAYIELRSRHATNPGATLLMALRCAAISVAKRQHASGIAYRDWFAISKPGYNKLAIAALRRCLESAGTQDDGDGSAD